MLDAMKDVVGFMTDLFQVLGTDWRTWLLFLGGIWIVATAFRFTIRLALGLSGRRGH